jgi:hypothetical protein
MPQFPTWRPPVDALADVVHARRTQVRDVAAGVVGRGLQTRDNVSAGIATFATGARTRGEQLPRSIVEELRRRINVLDLATKRDVELQSRLGRRRISSALNEFLAAQHAHERELLETLRAEIRAELESLASALNGDAFDGDAFDGDAFDGDAFDPDTFDALDTHEVGAAPRRRPRRAQSALDYLEDDDDIDLTEDEVRYSHSDATER